MFPDFFLENEGVFPDYISEIQIIFPDQPGVRNYALIYLLKLNN